jgi:hypothetical protein
MKKFGHERRIFWFVYLSVCLVAIGSIIWLIEKHSADIEPKILILLICAIAFVSQIGSALIVPFIRWLKNKAQRRQHIRWLTGLLENYSDEIPDKLVPSASRYKVRGTWWQGFRFAIPFALQDFPTVDPAIKTDFDLFFKKFDQRRAEWVQLAVIERKTDDWFRTTREEIDGANDLLRRMIAELRGKRRGK